MNTFKTVYTLSQTIEFSKWIRKLRDLNSRAMIIKRIQRASKGNLGDHKSVGSGVFELRIFFGPGYRVYFSFHDNKLLLLLIGGDKSTQAADIALAQRLKKDYEA